MFADQSNTSPQIHSSSIRRKIEEFRKRREEAEDYFTGRPMMMMMPPPPPPPLFNGGADMFNMHRFNQHDEHRPSLFDEEDLLDPLLRLRNLETRLITPKMAANHFGAFDEPNRHFGRRKSPELPSGSRPQQPNLEQQVPQKLAKTTAQLQAQPTDQGNLLIGTVEEQSLASRRQECCLLLLRFCQIALVKVVSLLFPLFHSPSLNWSEWNPSKSNLEIEW